MPPRSAKPDAASSERLSVPDLAARLEQVLEDRGLVAGDRFLTTDEAARLLRVRRDLANRALQVLVQRGRIERAQRIGARVLGPKQNAQALSRVHVVVQANHRRASAVSSPALQVGLHAALPGCEVALEWIKTGSAGAFFEPLVRRVLRQRQPEGLVLVRCDYPTQRMAADSGLPVVLHGSAYAGIRLSSVDVDGRQMGQTQAQGLAAHGCKRLVVVRGDRALPGDRAFMNGFRLVAEELGFASSQIDELQLAPFPEVVAAELGVLFDQPESIGIVCASRELADATWLAAQASDRLVGRNLWLHSNHPGRTQAAAPFPVLAPREGDEQQGKELGRLLAAKLADPQGDPEHHLIPCQLVEPGQPR